jgi:hypothetical protein
MDGSKTTATGNVAEQHVIELLSNIPIVTKVWKDVANSKFDIYYMLQNETCTRGLQVKAITIKRKTGNRTDYKMGARKNYPIGLLVVGLNKEEGIGLAFLYEKIHEGSAASMTKGAKLGGTFSKLLCEWDIFRERLIQLLPLSIIVTDAVFESSITPNMQASVESLKRFSFFCKKNGFTCTEVQDTSSKTDLIFEGAKAQLKYCANEVDARNHCYRVKLCTGKEKVPYAKGDNNIYIIEIGAHHGVFIFLQEDLLIEKGFIRTDTQPGKIGLDIFPYDYVEKAKLKSRDNASRCKGNWTCDKILWLSTENGLIK